MIFYLYEPFKVVTVIIQLLLTIMLIIWITVALSSLISLQIQRSFQPTTIPGKRNDSTHIRYGCSRLEHIQKSITFGGIFMLLQALKMEATLMKFAS